MYNSDEFYYAYFFLELSVPNPLTNDFCSTALEFPQLPADGSCVTLSSNTMYATGEGISTCLGNSEYDIWYKFSAPQDRSLVIYELDAGIGVSMTVQLIEGTCEEFTIRECIPFSQIDDFSNLTPGEVYFIHVVSSGGSIIAPHTLCLRSGPIPPPNDDCNNSLSLTSTPGLFADPGPQSTSGATDSDYDMCYPAHLTPSKTYDVWYSFTTDQDGGDATVTLTHAEYYPSVYYGYFNMVMQGFEGSCGDFNTVGCFDEATAISGIVDSTITINFFGLLPLETYYFRAFNSTFTGNYAPIDFTLNAVGTALDPIVAVDEEIASL
ncbi:MAG: hypothetical protein M3R25_11505, partial [Bacteroidota bacterium]|nr:hypothetical protein [Bacteroidota bacterium]